MAQIHQRTHNPVVAPAPVLAYETDHQPFNFRRYPRAARISAVSRPVELLCNQPPIPGQNGVRPGHACDVLQSFASESFRDLGQGGSLRIRQPKPGWQVGSEDAILGHQVFVAQQQLLVDEARHKGQKARPVKSIAHGKGSIIAPATSILRIRRVFSPNDLPGIGCRAGYRGDNPRRDSASSHPLRSASIPETECSLTCS